jgi:predicted nucleic-acid-binding Zn-ribbon protein
MNVKSSHASTVFDAEKNPHYRAYLNRLEQEEKIDEKLTNMRNREVKVVTCSTCSYTAFSQSDFCKLKRHQINRHAVLQRFFKCKSCSRRTYTLDKLIPVASCSTCGSDKYEPCTIKEDKSAQMSNSFNINF